MKTPVENLSMALSEKFPAESIEWRIQQGRIYNGQPWARVLAYITNRAIMDRLDLVCGCECWQNDFRELSDGSMLCGIGILINGIWVWKWDGASKTDIEPTKGGISSAMKRAGVQWDIGRYLYELPNTNAVFSENGEHTVWLKVDPKDKNETPKKFKWDPPRLPKQFLP